MQAKKFNEYLHTNLTNWKLAYEWLCFTLLMILAISVGGWCFWILDRGLELTDEAYYVLNGMYPDEIRLFFSPTHWLSSLLWRISGTLTGFRAIGLLILSTSSAVLAWGLMRASYWFGLPKPKTWHVKGMFLISSMYSGWLYCAVLNFSPSYNSLSTSGAYFSIGIVLSGLSSSNRRKSMFLLMLAGIALGLTIISKFSTGILITTLSIGFFVVLSNAPGATLRNAYAMLIIVPLTVLAMSLLFSSPSNAWNAFCVGLKLVNQAQQSEPVLARLMRNGFEVLGLFKAVLRNFWGPLLCIGGMLLLRHTFMGVIGALWFLANLTLGNFLLGGMDRYPVQSIPLTATVLFVMLLTSVFWISKIRTALLVIALFFLPFLIASGTSNPLPSQINLSLASWGLLCFVLMNIAQGSTRLLVIFLYVIFFAIIASQTVTSGMRAPYRLAHPLNEQTQVVEIDSIGKIRVDLETKKFVSDTKAVAIKCGINSGSPFLGFYDLPGLAMILGAVPLNTPWLFDEKFAHDVLNQPNPIELHSAFIAIKLDANGHSPMLPEQVKEYQKKYSTCGKLILPFQRNQIELWAPLAQ